MLYQIIQEKVLRLCSNVPDTTRWYIQFCIYIFDFTLKVNECTSVSASIRVKDEDDDGPYEEEELIDNYSTGKRLPLDHSRHDHLILCTYSPHGD